jgi:DNA invertase Pin-like site-specific DNA recombinase
MTESQNAESAIEAQLRQLTAQVLFAGWNTTTPHGQLMLTILGGLAEFERTLIRARTGEGRERAKARGVRFRRPKKALGRSASRGSRTRQRNHQASRAGQLLLTYRSAPRVPRKGDRFRKIQRKIAVNRDKSRDTPAILTRSVAL